MKLCRFQPQEFDAHELSRTTRESHPNPRAGIIEGDKVHEIQGELNGTRERAG